MKKIRLSTALVFAFAMSFMVFAAQPASADVMGNGSAITDNLQVGEITGISKGQLTIATKFEKKSKKYTLHMLPNAYVMTQSRGVFKKFTDLKKGDLVAAYGWYKDKKWNAVRIVILDPNHYLVKRLAADAAAGSYYKHER